MTEYSESKNHLTEPSIPEISRQRAYELVDALTALPTAETHDNIFGLETVDEHGEVKLMPVGEADSDEPDLKTTLAKLPLASYRDTLGQQHDVNLYARRVTGYYHEIGGDTDVALFAVDQATHDGSVRLAAKPGLLYRTGTWETGFELADDSQLSNAILLATGGSEGIKKLIESAQVAGDDAAIANLKAKIEAALQKRGPERVTTEGFDEQSWTDKGIDTPYAIADRQAAREVREEYQDKRWAELPRIKRIGAVAVAKLVHGRYADPKQVYFNRRYQRGDFR